MANDNSYLDSINQQMAQLRQQQATNGWSEGSDYEGQLRTLQDQYNKELNRQELARTGRNADGSYIRPEWESNLDPATGLLKDQYLIGKDFTPAGMDERGLTQFRNEALRDAGTQSVWAKAQNDRIASQQANLMSQADASRNAGMRGQMDMLASSGGVQGAARERAAQSSLRDLMRGKQDIRFQGAQAQSGVAVQDESNRMQMLSQLPGMDIAKGNFDRQGQQAQLTVQEANIRNALTERQAKRNDDMSAWTKNQEVWGANKQADTQKGGGGGGGCCFIFLEARYSNGTMDSVVRRFRDEHMTVRNKRGYYKLSEVLVPLMRKSVVVKFLIRALLTDPLVAYGKYHYGENKWGFIFKPVKNFWLKTFDYLGQEHQFIRENGEVI